ncbi:hypothetical protein [Gemmata sp.]|uniref:hypothetical protein n=1 Tax=Gemmata sp. TaxID=1914242 RepID=UPI003F71C004
MNPSSDDAHDGLLRDLGLKRLRPVWAKFEIFFGLGAVGGSVFGGLYLAANANPSGWLWPCLTVVFTLGGYLALAGHRSHLYQSSNRLAAHLADLIRKPPHAG